MSKKLSTMWKDMLSMRRLKIYAWRLNQIVSSKPKKQNFIDTSSGLAQRICIPIGVQSHGRMMGRWRHRFCANMRSYLYLFFRFMVLHWYFETLWVGFITCTGEGGHAPFFYPANSVPFPTLRLCIPHPKSLSLSSICFSVSGVMWNESQAAV